MIVSPSLLGYQSNLIAQNNDIYAGIAVVTLSLVNLVFIPVRSSILSWVIGFLGLWQIGAPFLLAYSGSSIAMVSAVVAGIIVVAISLWQILTVSEESEIIIRKFTPGHFTTSYASGISLRKINKERS